MLGQTLGLILGLLGLLALVGCRRLGEFWRAYEGYRAYS